MVSVTVSIFIVLMLEIDNNISKPLSSIFLYSLPVIHYLSLILQLVLESELEYSGTWVWNFNKLELCIFEFIRLCNPESRIIWIRIFVLDEYPSSKFADFDNSNYNILYVNYTITIINEKALINVNMTCAFN